jgi:hypothetical protein
MEDSNHMKFLPITAIMLLAMSSSALAVTNTPAPVEIKACVVMSASSADSVLVPGVSLTNGVTVTMTNTSGKTIQSVTVTGDYHGRKETGTAAFQFKPGTTAEITRHYTQSAYVGPIAQCSVDKVIFADGTTWP